MLLRLACLGMLLVGASCHSAQESELAGTYIAGADWGGSTLILKNDHTMEQTVRFRTGGFKKITGTWQLEDGYVTLKPCFIVRHDRGGQLADVCSSSATVMGLAHVEIALDPDWGIAYRRK